jgi:hypothetical protein
MLDHVSAVSVADYLGYFEDLGYSPTVLDSSTGVENPYRTVAAMLDDWDGVNKLHDILLVPSAETTYRECP